MSYQIILFLAIVACLDGCTMAPKYVQPKASIPSGWPLGDAYAEKAASTAPEPRNLKWKEFFLDEKLRVLIDLALKNNRDLRIAALNVELAQAQPEVASN